MEVWQIKIVELWKYISTVFQMLIKQIKNSIDSLNLNAILLITGHVIRVFCLTQSTRSYPLSEG